MWCTPRDPYRPGCLPSILRGFSGSVVPWGGILLTWIRFTCPLRGKGHCKSIESCCEGSLLFYDGSRLFQDENTPIGGSLNGLDRRLSQRSPPPSFKTPNQGISFGSQVCIPPVVSQRLVGSMPRWTRALLLVAQHLVVFSFNLSLVRMSFAVFLWH